MDLPYVIEILHRVVPVMNEQGNFQWDNEYPSDAVLRRDISNRHMYVALDEAKIIGAVTINAEFPVEYEAVPWASSPNTFTFHRLMVSPDHYGKGVGRALFSYIEQRGIWMGLRSIRVDTNKKNKPMLALFNEFEYKKVGSIQLRESGSDDDFYCFEKTIRLNYYV